MPLPRFTHIAKIYGFKCYFNEFTGEVEGIGWFNESMIDIFIWLDVTLCINVDFRIELIEEI